MSRVQYPGDSRQTKQEERGGFFTDCYECWTIDKENFFEGNTSMKRESRLSYQRHQKKISIRSMEAEAANREKERATTKTSSVTEANSLNASTYLPLPQYAATPQHRLTPVKLTIPQNNDSCYSLKSSDSSLKLSVQDSIRTTSQTILNKSQGLCVEATKLQKTKPKLFFSYRSPQEQPKVEAVIQRPPKMIHFQEEEIEHEVSVHKSPIKQLFENKEMLASLELNRNSSIKSGKSLKSKKKTSVYESVFGKGKLKIRQAQSIREPEEDEDHVSIVISSSSFMNNSLFGLLVPIRELEFESFSSVNRALD